VFVWESKEELTMKGSSLRDTDTENVPGLICRISTVRISGVFPGPGSKLAEWKLKDRGWKSEEVLSQEEEVEGSCQAEGNDPCRGE